MLFVEAPRFPPRSIVYAQRIAMFDADMQEFCAETGALSWDREHRFLDLTAEDFQDTIHLGNPKRRREFTDLLMHRLSEILSPASNPAESDADADAAKADEAAGTSATAAPSVPRDNREELSASGPEVVFQGRHGIGVGVVAQIRVAGVVIVCVGDVGQALGLVDPVDKPLVQDVAEVAHQRGLELSATRAGVPRWT